MGKQSSGSPLLEAPIEEPLEDEEVVARGVRASVGIQCDLEPSELMLF